MKNSFVNPNMLDQPMKVYNLYCMNAQCPDSIYAGKAELQVPGIAKNWIGLYLCTRCNHPFVPAGDEAIKPAITGAGYEALISNIYSINQTQF